MQLHPQQGARLPESHRLLQCLQFILPGQTVGAWCCHISIPKWLSQKTKTYHTKLYLVGGFNMSNIRRKNCAEPLPHHRPYVWYCMVYVLPLRRMHIFPFGLQFKPYLVFVYWCWWYINIIPDLDGLCVLGTHQNRATRKSCRLLSIKLAVSSPSRSV